MFHYRVQDTSASPEIYPAVLPSGSFGAWGLAESVGSSDLPNLHSLREREVLWAVSIPGESPFVAEVGNNFNHLLPQLWFCSSPFVFSTLTTWIS